MIKQILKKIDQKFSIQMLTKIICVLLILFLLIHTESVWGSWASMAQSIFQPFLIGFVLAYIMHPLVEFLEKKGIPKNFSILAIWVCVLVVMIAILVLVMPMLYEKLNEFMVSMIDGVVWISNKIKTLGNMNDFSLVNSITNNIVALLESYDDWFPQIVSSLPGLMNSVIGVVTNALFSVIIAIYMLFDFERIKQGIRKICQLFFNDCEPYLSEIDQNVSVYIRSMIIIMLIKFVEYSTFYFMIGHPDWLIIGLLTSILSIIPYIGGAIANSIGIITALTLPPSNIIALIMGILILSNVDAYVISPLVHEKRSSVGPLITLLAVFAGGVIMGPIGIMASMPVAIAWKTALDVYEKRHDHKLYEQAMKISDDSET
ncbi:AI-2E family transporter [Erysipelotrichaceae bacterium HCN-30851]